MLNISGIHEGFVLDHIQAGMSLQIYHDLKLDKLDCSVAIIKNAKSNKMGKKDIIKVECPIEALDLDILGFIDHNITVNVIKGDRIVEKKELKLPKQVKNVIKCKNPRCVTSIEQDNGGGRTRTAEAYIGAGRSRSGNGDAGSSKVGLDFTKPGKAAAGFRGKTVVCCLIRGGRKNRNRGRRCRQCRVWIRFQKCHIGGGKSGDREPDVEIRRRWKSAVNLKRPDTGGRIQHADPTPGIWTLQVYRAFPSPPDFHIWLPITGFSTSDVTFLEPDPYTTLTTPSATVPVLSPSTYQAANNSFSPESGRGFTRLGEIKPDFAAPGVSVTGPGPAGSYVSFSGSSASAAIILLDRCHHKQILHLMTFLTCSESFSSFFSTIRSPLITFTVIL